MEPQDIINHRVDDDEEEVDVDEFEEDDDDVVVQEIDVFVSSISVPIHNNTSTIAGNSSQYHHRTYLMQYPGHWNHQQPLMASTTTSTNHTTAAAVTAVVTTATADQQQPVSIRIKPRHNIIEAEHEVESGWQKNDNVVNTTTTRTYESQTIPMNTHLCFGKYMHHPSSTELHLIPITHVTQMRPSFQHLTNHLLNPDDDHEDDDNNDFNNDDDENPNTTTMTTTSTITYQRKESDRAIAARKSSYAYQKQSQDQEVFLPLQVLVIPVTRDVPDAITTTTNRRSSIFPSDSQSAPSRTAYLQSLNYLVQPLSNTNFNHAHNTTTVVTTTQLPPRDMMDMTDHNYQNVERKRILSRIMTILQWNNGPIPFSILILSIQEKNHTHAARTTITTTADKATTTTPEPLLQLLLSVLNTIAVLVRGNWYIHSKFMTILPHPSILRSNRRQQQSSSASSSSTVSLLHQGPMSASSVIIVGSNTNHQQLIYKKLQQRIRTFALLLLHLYGKIYKLHFIRACNSGTATTTSNTPQCVDDSLTETSNNQKLFNILLHQIARPTKDGYWVGKIQDDVPFQQLYSGTVTAQHNNFWNHQQTLRFQKELQYYNTNKKE